jgi:hypothetical protein
MATSLQIREQEVADLTAVHTDVPSNPGLQAQRIGLLLQNERGQAEVSGEKLAIGTQRRPRHCKAGIETHEKSKPSVGGTDWNNSTG